jgi:hypothetical protein
MTLSKDPSLSAVSERTLAILGNRSEYLNALTRDFVQQLKDSGNDVAVKLAIHFSNLLF